MIILDTNIFSALLQSTPERIIVEWLDSLNPTLIRTTTITVYEVYYGIEKMVKGKRQKHLSHAFGLMLHENFKSKILDFDYQSARKAAEIAAFLKNQGHNIGTHDLQIAGIAQTNGAMIATRNEKDFPDNDIINPWRDNH